MIFERSRVIFLSDALTQSSKSISSLSIFSLKHIQKMCNTLVKEFTGSCIQHLSWISVYTLPVVYLFTNECLISYFVFMTVILRYTRSWDGRVFMIHWQIALFFQEIHCYSNSISFTRVHSWQYQLFPFLRLQLSLSLSIPRALSLCLTETTSVYRYRFSFR